MTLALQLVSAAFPPLATDETFVVTTCAAIVDTVNGLSVNDDRSANTFLAVDLTPPVFAGLLDAIDGATVESPIVDVIVDGETGLLAAKGDSDGLATALTRLATDHTPLVKMGEAARRSVVEQFDQNRVIDRIV